MLNNKPKPKVATLLRTIRDVLDPWPLKPTLDTPDFQAERVDIPDRTICEVVYDPRHDGSVYAFSVWFPQYEKYFTNALTRWFHDFEDS